MKQHLLLLQFGDQLVQTSGGAAVGLFVEPGAPARIVSANSICDRLHSTF
jgi:hypothetical protein